MSRLMEWERVCLVCLQTGENRCIFGKDSDSIVIADKIMKYSAILIKRDTNQPKTICLQCLDDLNVVSKFHRNYEQSESIIKALLNTNHQEFQIKDLWKTSSTTANPILGICIKDEVMDNTTVDDGCDNTPCPNLEDNAGTESKPFVEDRADSYVHSKTTELNNKSRQEINYKMPKRSRGRQKILSEESIFTSDYKRPMKHPRVRPKLSTGVSLKICEICNRNFTKQSDLNVHMRRHNNVRPFSCDHCDKTFVTTSDLVRHVRVHTGERPYKCPTCDKRFGYSHALRLHLRTHNKFTCKEFRREVFQKHANRHLNRVEVNNSSEHTQTKLMDKEIFQIQENTNSNEINIKHEIVEDDLIGDNFDIGTTACIDEENGPVSDATNGEIPKQSTGVSLKICEVCNHSFKYQSALDMHMRRHNNVRPFSCDHCDKTFVSSGNLGRHVRVHTGEKPYKCQYCDLRFSRIDHRRMHESKHPAEKPFKCPTCDKSFAYSHNVSRHLRIHNKSTCEEIRREKVFEKDANRHLNRVEVNNSSEHTQIKSLGKEIFQIQENTNSNEINIKHELVEGNLIGDNSDIGSTPCIDEENDTVSEATNGEIPKPSTLKICEICNRDFRTQTKLDIHMRRHNNVRPFSCDNCDKTFVTSTELRSHVRIHTGEKPYKCQYCELRFSRIDYRRMHENNHTGEKPFKCPICDKSFGYPQGLRLHLRTHTKFTCKEFRREKLCQKRANRHLNLVEVNKSTEHTQKKSLEKEIFEIQENTNSNEIIIKHEIVEDNLIGHNCDIGSTPCIDVDNGPVPEATNGDIVQQSKGEIPKHPTVRPKQSTRVSLTVCVICNHDFKKKGLLDRHMRRHNNERPFSCDYCDKAFVTRTEVRLHVRVHTGEKPYKCQYCGLRFSHSDVRLNHESKHTGEKPYKCPTCDKGFGYSTSLKCHLRIHNGENEFSSKKCGEEFTKKVHFQRHVAQHLTGNELDQSLEHEQIETTGKVNRSGRGLRLFKGNKYQT